MTTSMVSNKYVFKPYHSSFPELFKAEKNRIQNLIGENFPILHMGSTAVPGLGGKGIIDIYIPVPRTEMNNVSKKIQTLGYEFCPDSGNSNRLFHKIDLKDSVEGIRRYHLHIVSEESADFVNSLFFRNFLRKDTDSLNDYANIKQHAAAIAGESKEIYMSTKEVVIRQIINKAFYDLVSQIPRGRVATYGQMTKICGLRSPRYAGYLLSRNTAPKTIPCHRVIHSDGRIAGNYAFGGLGVKKQRLRDEGVEITNNRIDLKRFGWQKKIEFDD